ncbi:hypothetical protein Plhal304r1_c040g0118471 [Plasmopara halstedii]
MKLYRRLFISAALFLVSVDLVHSIEKEQMASRDPVHLRTRRLADGEERNYNIPEYVLRIGFRPLKLTAKKGISLLKGKFHDMRAKAKIQSMTTKPETRQLKEET